MSFHQAPIIWELQMIRYRTSLFSVTFNQVLCHCHWLWLRLLPSLIFAVTPPIMQLLPWMYDQVADHNSSPFPRFCTIQITPFSPVRAPQASHCLLTLTPNSPIFGTCPSSSSLSFDFDFNNLITCFGMEGVFSVWHCVIATSSSRLEIPTAN
jgi:hypothetical protein